MTWSTISLKSSFGGQATVSDSLSLIALIISVFALGLVIYSYSKCLGSVKGKVSMFAEALNSKVVRAYVKASEARGKRKLSKRYMILKVLGNSSNIKEIQEIVEDGIIRLFGSSAISLIQPRILYYNPNTAKAILRFKASYKWKLIASLGLSEGLSNTLILIPIRTTGTLKKARKYADTPN